MTRKKAKRTPVIQPTMSIEEYWYEYRSKRLKNMAAEMEKLRPFSEGGYYPWKNTAAYKLAHEAQALACSARNLPILMPYWDSWDTPQSGYQEIFGIQVRITPEEWYQIDMPLLMPSNRRFASPWFLREPLDQALSQYRYENFEQTHYFYNIRHCVIVIRNFYNRNVPCRALRDRYNIETNALADSVSFYTMVDDSALECFHFYRSEPADRDYTEVLVMPREDLEQWCRENPLPEKLSCYPCDGEIYAGMDREAFTRIDGFQEKAGQLAELIKMPDAIRQVWKSGQIKSYISQSKVLFTESQKFALWSRGLPYVLPVFSEPASVEPYDENSGIRISNENGILKIYLPGMLPKKEAKGKKWLLRGQFAASLRRYFEDRNPIPAEGCLVAFVNSYDRNKRELLYRDNDNVDVSAVLDETAPYCNGFDPMHAPHFYMAQKADDDHAEVFFLPVGSFPDWLKARAIK